MGSIGVDLAHLRLTLCARTKGPAGPFVFFQARD